MQALVEAYSAGASIRALARQHGVSHAAIHRRLRGRVAMRPVGGRSGGNFIPQEVRDAVAGAYARNMPMADIIAQFGVCDETVRRFADEAGIPRRPVGGRTRLDAGMIATLAGQGWPPEAIAVLLGCRPSRVRKILADLAQDGDAATAEPDGNGAGQ